MGNGDELEARLRHAVGLREQGLDELSCAELRVLAGEYPDDAEVNFQTAWSHDNAGLEQEAIPFYERALKLPGLTGEQRQAALLGLGSSYRLVDRAADAVQVLEDAVGEFPENAALRVFLAIACHAAGRHGRATGTLLELLASTSADSSIIDYRRAILEYSREYISE